MLEILALMALTKRIGSIVEQKGHKSGGYKFLTVILWFGGEVVGAILGTLMAGGDDSARCLIYIIALAGAAAGAGIAYAIANNAITVGPSRIPMKTSTGQLPLSPSNVVVKTPAEIEKKRVEKEQAREIYKKKIFKDLGRCEVCGEKIGIFARWRGETRCVIHQNV